MGLSPFWEAASSSDSQEFFNILRNPKLHCHTRNLLLVADINQMNAAHTTPSYSSKIHFNIILLAKLKSTASVV
jgi:hypothetical protein